MSTTSFAFKASQYLGLMVLHFRKGYSSFQVFVSSTSLAYFEDFFHFRTLTLSYITHCTIHPRTSDSTYVYIYRHGLENKSTSLHCYVASMLNTNLLFGYAPQLLMLCQLCADSSSVSRLAAPTHFVPHGSNNNQ